MRRLAGAVTAAVAFFWGAAALAQATSYVQIEAHRTRAEAETRARAYAGAFGDVKGFRLPSGWYAIALGPYPRAEAARRLAELRAERLIPADSFLVEAQRYGAPFWPPAGEAAAAETAASPAPAAEAPPPAGEAAPAAALPDETLPDETLAEARRSEAALGRAEREALQIALQWKGFYAAAIDGAFGPATRAAMQAWQAANGHEPTGVLTSRQRAELLTAYEAEIAAIGLRTLREEAAGIEAVLPLGLVEFEGYDPPFVRYRPRGDSGVSVRLISKEGDAAALAGLYEALQTLDVVPPDGPRQRGATSFTISARGPAVESYSFAELREGLIKGYMLIWEPRAAARIPRIAEAMRAGFAPFGSHALEIDAGGGAEAMRSALLQGLEARRPLRTRSGVFVDGRGHVLTSADAVEGCGRILLDEAHEALVAARDPLLGVALLRPRAPLAPRGVAGLRMEEPPAPPAPVAVAGYSWGEVMPRPVLSFGSLAGLEGPGGEAGRARLDIAVRPGDAGGPVLDATGAVVGILLPPPEVEGRLLPATVQAAARAEALAPLLARAGITVTPGARGALPLAAEDLAERADAMTVLVSCWP